MTSQFFSTDIYFYGALIVCSDHNFSYFLNSFIHSDTRHRCEHSSGDWGRVCCKETQFMGSHLVTAL